MYTMLSSMSIFDTKPAWSSLRILVSIVLCLWLFLEILQHYFLKYFFCSVLSPFFLFKDSNYRHVRACNTLSQTLDVSVFILNSLTLFLSLCFNMVLFMDLSSNSLILSSVMSSLLMSPFKPETLKCMTFYPMYNLTDQFATIILYIDY